MADGAPRRDLSEIVNFADDPSPTRRRSGAGCSHRAVGVPASRRLRKGNF